MFSKLLDDGQNHSSAGFADKLPQVIAKSVGGNSTKIHLAVDDHSHPLEFLFGDGVTHDIKMAPKLLRLLDLSNTQFLNADRGYDCMKFRDSITIRETQGNLPKKNNSLLGNSHMNWYIYGVRYVVALVCAYVWLKL